jgi:hypothetical protein
VLRVLRGEFVCEVEARKQHACSRPIHWNSQPVKQFGQLALADRQRRNVDGGGAVEVNH